MLAAASIMAKVALTFMGISNAFACLRVRAGGPRALL